jgi:hypothetical protein
MHVGAIAFQRPDAMLSRVVLSVTPNLLVRVDLVQHGEIDDDVLRFCCHKLARQYNMAARLLLFAPDLTRQRKQPSKSSGGRIALIPISEHLYDGTGIYEGASFIVKPEIRTFLGRRLRILQLGYSRSLEQFEADFESRYSKAILSGDEEG